MKKSLIAISYLLTLASCSNYYKVVTTKGATNSTVSNDLRNPEKYYILRNGKDAFTMKNISISSDHKDIECTLETLPPEHQLHLSNGRQGKLKFRKPVADEVDERAVLNEVHIFLNPDKTLEPGQFTTVTTNIVKVETIEFDKVKTRKNHTTMTLVGIGSTVVLVGGIIAIIVGNSLNFGL